MARSELRTPQRWLVSAAVTVVIGSSAGAQDAVTATEGTLVGSPAIDFSTGTAAPNESQVYVWVDAAGVTHFTDQPVDYLTRFRDQFRPVSLFVNPAGQPKR